MASYQLRRRALALTRRMPPSEQQVEQHAQRIHIRGYGDCLAFQLLGSSVLGRQRGSAYGKGRLPFRVVLGLDQLGYSEVQQLDVAVLPHQHVRRFEVAVDNQVCVGRCDRIQYLKKKADARGKVKLALIAVAVDLVAVDIFEHEIGLPCGGNSGVDQLGNMRVGKQREYPAFAFEAVFALFSEERDVEKLQGYLAFETSIVAPCQPDASHATLADL